jgi:hypothetical protein
MILSGLRVFDIRDPYHPVEIAYFNAPVQERSVLDPSSYAMSSPAFVPERREIWYSDGFSGFYNVRLTNGAWPAEPTARGAPSSAVDAAGSGSAGPTVAAGSTGRLPATGGRVPGPLVASTSISGLLLLLALRRARSA